jgi:hypothetical protein
MRKGGRGRSAWKGRYERSAWKVKAEGRFGKIDAERLQVVTGKVAPTSENKQQQVQKQIPAGQFKSGMTIKSGLLNKE